MALYHYFSTIADTLLPDLRGSLAKQVPSTRITSTNDEVSWIPDVLVHVVPTYHRRNAEYVNISHHDPWALSRTEQRFDSHYPLAAHARHLSERALQRSGPIRKIFAPQKDSTIRY